MQRTDSTRLFVRAVRAMCRLAFVLAFAMLIAACAPKKEPCAPSSIDAAVDAALGEGRPARADDLPGCTVAGRVLDDAWRTAACESAGAWRFGLAGVPRLYDCPGAVEALDEAHFLGSEYRRLAQARAGLDPTEDALEYVRLTREIDALVGLAQVHRWPLPTARDGEGR